jgi:hypothetical protein
MIDLSNLSVLSSDLAEPEHKSLKVPRVWFCD